MNPPLPIFPEPHGWARMLFTEGIRHLEDARVLHTADRYTAGIASAMKAAELGMKAVLALDGSLGWWDKLHTSHKPLTDIGGHPILLRHAELLESRSPTLPGEVRELESLAPERPGAASFRVASRPAEATEANPEYPFFTALRDPATGILAPRQHSPASYYRESDSQRYYGVARQLLAALQALYPEIAGWMLTLPDSL